MKKGDKVQVWDKKNSVCLGWGEVIGIGVGAKKEVLLVEIGNDLLWGDEYHFIPEQKAFEIARRIEGNLR